MNDKKKDLIYSASLIIVLFICFLITVAYWKDKYKQWIDDIIQKLENNEEYQTCTEFYKVIDKYKDWKRMSQDWLNLQIKGWQMIFSWDIAKQNAISEARNILNNLIKE